MKISLLVLLWTRPIFWTSISPTHYNRSIPELSISDLPEVVPTDCPDIFLCSEYETYELLCTLDTTKCCGDDISAHMLKEPALLSLSFSISHLNLMKFQMNGRLPVSHPFQNHTTSPIQEATAQSHCSLCWANCWKTRWETYWLTTLKNSILSLPNNGYLPMVNPPLEFYSLLLITGTDYLTQDLTSVLYSSTLVKRSTQSPTDPYYRSSKTLMSTHTSWNG